MTGDGGRLELTTARLRPCPLAGDDAAAVVASVDPRDSASMRLLERLGLRREAWFRQSLWFKGEWADHVIYAILAPEWQARTTTTEQRES